MIGSRIHIKRLAELCRRLALSTAAGLDDRRIWQREAEMRGRTWQLYVGRVRDAVARGQSVSLGLESTENYFPRLFRELVGVGERSGKLAYVYRRLAEHYERTLRVRRGMIGQLIWPLIQLVIAILVVGLLIWIMGILPRAVGGPSLDPTGFGLTGSRGLFIYANFIIGIAIALLLFLEAARRGAFWIRRLQEFALRTPLLGKSLETLCLARIAWSLHLTLDTDMNLVTALPLVLRSAGNHYYEKHARLVTRYIQDGHEIHEALAATRAFPRDFLEIVEVGEASGTLPEAMERLSQQYEERAEVAIRSLSMMVSIGVWIAVAALIIWMIFRLALFYINTLYSALG